MLLAPGDGTQHAGDGALCVRLCVRLCMRVCVCMCTCVCWVSVSAVSRSVPFRLISWVKKTGRYGSAYTACQHPLCHTGHVLTPSACPSEPHWWCVNQIRSKATSSLRFLLHLALLDVPDMMLQLARLRSWPCLFSSVEIFVFQRVPRYDGPLDTKPCFSFLVVLQKSQGSMHSLDCVLGITVLTQQSSASVCPSWAFVTCSASGLEHWEVAPGFYFRSMLSNTVASRCTWPLN